jgi:hypothetical protein
LTPLASDLTGLTFSEEEVDTALGRRFSHSSRACSMSEGRVGDSITGRPCGFDRIGESIGGSPCLLGRASSSESVSALTFLVGVETSSSDESLFRFSGRFSGLGGALAEPFGLVLPFMTGTDFVAGEGVGEGGLVEGEDSRPASLLLYSARLIFFRATGGVGGSLTTEVARSLALRSRASSTSVRSWKQLSLRSW